MFISVAPYNIEIIGIRRYSYNSDIELNCTSEGGPQLEYSWIFLDNTIDNITMLRIGSATVTNGGDYACNVTNNAGFSSIRTTIYSELIKLLLCMLLILHNTMLIIHTEITSIKLIFMHQIMCNFIFKPCHGLNVTRSGKLTM